MTPALRFPPRLLGCARRLAAPWLLAPAVAAADLPAPDIAEVRDLAAGGAPALALRLVDGAQPASPARDAAAWRRWERQRLAVLELMGAWDTLAARVAGYDATLPPDFLRHARLKAVRARLRQGDGAAARRLLRRLVWQGEAVPPDLEALRRLVVESYLVEGNAADAATALLRHRLDYGGGDAAWRRLEARVMLLADRPAEASQVLEGLTDPEARFLRLLAGLAGGATGLDEGRRAVAALAAEDALTSARRYQLAAALVDLARAPDQRVAALEEALGHRRLADGPLLAAVRPADLWGAYRAYAGLLANVHQLLIGHFEGWLELAGRLAERDPPGARSLLAYVATESRDPVWRREAEEALVAALRALPEGLEVLRQLYLEGGRETVPAELPAAVRHGLVEQALAGGDMALAAALARGLEAPPDAADALQWPLRQARILVLGGRPGEGARVLDALLERHPGLTAQDLDRVNQVLFDLQAVDEPGLAHDLFARLLEQAQDAQLRRELLFWMAEARAAEGRALAAARLYLRSAMLPGPRTMDQWARAARYHAAAQLAEAGLPEDARSLYRLLLETTDDPERAAVLRRALRRLDAG